MTKNSAEVSVAVDGAVSKVPASLQVSSATSPLTGGEDLGFTSEDGVEIANGSSTENIVAWQNASIVRTYSTDNMATYTFTLIQNTKAARELFYGTPETNGKIKWRPTARARGKFVVDYIDLEYGDVDEALYGRHVIHDGRVTEVGAITLSSGEPIGYNITITGYANSEGVVADIFTQVVNVDNPTPEPEPEPGGDVVEYEFTVQNITANAADNSVDVQFYRSVVAGDEGAGTAETAVDVSLVTDFENLNGAAVNVTSTSGIFGHSFTITNLVEIAEGAAVRLTPMQSSGTSGGYSWTTPQTEVVVDFAEFGIAPQANETWADWFARVGV